MLDAKDELKQGARPPSLPRVRLWFEFEFSIKSLQGVWEVFRPTGSAQIPERRHVLGAAPHAFYPTLVTGSPSHSAPQHVAMNTLGLGCSSHTVHVLL